MSKRRVLWAIGTASILAFASLHVGAIASAASSASTWLLPSAVALLVIASFRSIHDLRHPVVRFEAKLQQSFWGVHRQSDGTHHLQISTVFDVYNLGDQPIIFGRLVFTKSRLKAETMIHARVDIMSQSNRVGQFIPPGKMATLLIHNIEAALQRRWGDCCPLPPV